ncbi:MAG: hypothetical protein Rubg2KO_22560 [Rubricoccaceae bacterium]
MVALAGLIAACGETPVQDSPRLAGALEDDPQYTTLVQLAAETGVLSLLESGGPYTVLAPTDIAFKYVGADALPVLASPEQRTTLGRVLRHHVIEGVLAPEDFVDGTVLTSLEGRPLRVERVRNEVVIEGATIDLGDASVAENGVAYPTSNVIRSNLTVRERIELSPALSRFADFGQETGVLDEAEALSQRTILVPLNDAFDAIPATTALLSQSRNADILAKVLRLHILSGTVDLATVANGTRLETLGGQTLTVTQENGAIYVDGTRVVNRSYDAANGRIYLFSGVLFKGVTLAERLRVLPRVTTFPVRTQLEADIWARMNDPGDALTVFAPNDGVYVRRNQDVATALSQPENAALLRRTRRVQVVEGSYAPHQLVNGLVLQALDGSELNVVRSEDDIFVGGQKVTPTGTLVNNGALYTMNSFIPPPVDLFDTTLLKGFTIQADAIRAAGLETLYRTTGPSAFVMSNRYHRGDFPRVTSLPNLADILRFHTMDEVVPFPLQGGMSFTMLDGANRRVCGRYISPLDPPGPLRIDGIVKFNDLGEPDNAVLSFDGRGRLFPVDTLLHPPPRQPSRCDRPGSG